MGHGRRRSVVLLPHHLVYWHFRFGFATRKTQTHHTERKSVGDKRVNDARWLDEGQQRHPISIAIVDCDRGIVILFFYCQLRPLTRTLRYSRTLTNHAYWFINFPTIAILLLFHLFVGYIDVLCPFSKSQTTQFRHQINWNPNTSSVFVRPAHFWMRARRQNKKVRCVHRKRIDYIGQTRQPIWCQSDANWTKHVDGK